MRWYDMDEDVLFWMIGVHQLKHRRYPNKNFFCQIIKHMLIDNLTEYFGQGTDAMEIGK